MSESTSTIVVRGGCICGAVGYQVTGTPILSAYCHCTGCQKQMACAFIHTIHFPGATSLLWTHAEPHEAALGTFTIDGIPWIRYRCKNCGCSVSSYNTEVKKWSVWGGQFEREEGGKIKGWEEIKPTAHIFYDTRMLDVNDSLGKWAGYENRSERLA